MSSCTKFEMYHKENPQIYEAFERFSLDVIRTGRKYFSAEMVINRIRWYTTIESDNDKFKVNNNYKPHYSRMFEENHPEYKGFFRKRRSHADQRSLFV
jgi:hypothetical protein